MFSRQIEAIGIESHQKLSSSKAAVVGMGGLGCSASLFLSRAGVKLFLVDDDIVERSNLGRQILFSEKDIGKKKVFSAKKELEKSGADVEVLDKRVGPNWKTDCDVLVDCTDNNKTRFYLNKIASKLSIPYIYGACGGWIGMAALLPSSRPCLRCFLAKKSSERGGQIAPVVGMTGSLQAALALNALLGDLEPKLFHIDLKKGTKSVPIEPKTDCKCSSKF